MEKLNSYEQVTNQMIEALELSIANGTSLAPWSGYSVSNAAVNFITEHKYQGGNQMFLQFMQSAKGYKTNYWAGFSQWAANGASVKEGEKGMKIMRPKLFKDKDTDVMKLGGMRIETIFNIEQTDMDISSVNPKTAKEVNAIEQADSIINAMPQRPTIRHTSPNMAFYSPVSDSVTMPVAVTCSSEEYYSILFHELAHSTGHESRLKRESLNKIQGFGSHEYSKEELVAEMTAAILCNESGIKNTIGNSTSYCASWLKVLKNDRKFLFEAATHSWKAANFILGNK